MNDVMTIIDVEKKQIQLLKYATDDFSSSTRPKKRK